MPLQPSSDSPPDLELAFTPSLHPHLVINADAPPGDCRLYLALSLPDALFPDPDELTDLWGPADSAGAGVRWSLAPRRIDIERPADSSDSSLTAVRLDVSVPSPPAAGQAVADIPLHARYLPPSEDDGWDVAVFGAANPVRAAWACDGQCKPASRVVQADARPAPEFHDVPAQLSLQLPAARQSYQITVETVTTLAVWAAAAYIAWCVVRLLRRRS